MITYMQMIQFLCMNAQAVYLLLNEKSCPFPSMVTKFYLGYIISLLVLFMNFTLHEYGGKKKTSSKSTDAKKDAKKKN